jgi:hypothetical protein
MDLVALRSILQHVCFDLKNLTIAEFQECKWPVKKKIFTSLFAIAPLLNDRYDEIETLLVRRNEESAIHKRDGATREDRLDAESIFRTDFMRIVLSGLTDLRWPPATKAFSDPMDDLFNNKTTFHECVEFLVTVAVPNSGEFLRQSVVPSDSSRTFTPSDGPHNKGPNGPKSAEKSKSRFGDLSISYISQDSSTHSNNCTDDSYNECVSHKMEEHYLSDGPAPAVHNMTSPSDNAADTSYQPSIPLVVPPLRVPSSSSADSGQSSSRSQMQRHDGITKDGFFAAKNEVNWKAFEVKSQFLKLHFTFINILVVFR